MFFNIFGGDVESAESADGNGRGHVENSQEAKLEGEPEQAEEPPGTRRVKHISMQAVSNSGYCSLLLPPCCVVLEGREEVGETVTISSAEAERLSNLYKMLAKIQAQQAAEDSDESSVLSRTSHGVQEPTIESRTWYEYMKSRLVVTR
uniref:Uncharacterized protein n=1 Tax=Fibrocapsa japonica TaxID=94617 RepID=A0A7S2UZ00_9STRA|mmetsp:Transcript_21345/g.30950  ORF Transcript_21345/g.30950 Transcript_21345/m.30950 type:complete len:148 (+) Transcript_21345:34-477(+)